MRHCKVILLYWKLFRKMCKGSDVKIPSQALAFVKIKLERHILIIICVGDVEFNLALQGGGKKFRSKPGLNRRVILPWSISYLLTGWVGRMKKYWPQFMMYGPSALQAMHHDQEPNIFLLSSTNLSQQALRAVNFVST